MGTCLLFDEYRLLFFFGFSGFIVFFLEVLERRVAFRCFGSKIVL